LRRHVKLYGESDGVRIYEKRYEEETELALQRMMQILAVEGRILVN